MKQHRSHLDVTASNAQTHPAEALMHGWGNAATGGLSSSPHTGQDFGSNQDMMDAMGAMGAMGESNFEPPTPRPDPGRDPLRGLHPQPKQPYDKDAVNLAFQEPCRACEDALVHLTRSLDLLEDQEELTDEQRTMEAESAYAAFFHAIDVDYTVSGGGAVSTTTGVMFQPQGGVSKDVELPQPVQDKVASEAKMARVRKGYIQSGMNPQPREFEAQSSMPSWTPWENQYAPTNQDLVPLLENALVALDEADGPHDLQILERDLMHLHPLVLYVRPKPTAANPDPQYQNVMVGFYVHSFEYPAIDHLGKAPDMTPPTSRNFLVLYPNGDLAETPTIHSPDMDNDLLRPQLQHIFDSGSGWLSPQGYLTNGWYAGAYNPDAIAKLALPNFTGEVETTLTDTSTMTSTELMAHDPNTTAFHFSPEDAGKPTNDVDLTIRDRSKGKNNGNDIRLGVQHNRPTIPIQNGSYRGSPEQLSAELYSLLRERDAALANTQDARAAEIVTEIETRVVDVEVLNAAIMDPAIRAEVKALLGW